MKQTKKASRRHPRGHMRARKRTRKLTSKPRTAAMFAAGDGIRTIFDEKTCDETLIVRFGPENTEIAMSGERAVMLSLELQRASRDAAKTRERLKTAYRAIALGARLP